MGTPYKMKGSSFKMMGSSPVKGKDDDKRKTYESTLDSVTANMTDKELRAMAVSQHKVKGKARGGKWNISYDTLLKQRRAMQPKVEKKASEVKESKKKVVAPATLKESNRFYFNKKQYADKPGYFSEQEGLGERDPVVGDAIESGKIRDLRVAVEQKYGKEFSKMDDQDPNKQMAGDAMIDKEGNILPMSSASGQYSGNIKEQDVPIQKRGYIMKRNRK